MTPGLNDVLGAHEVEHGVNDLKSKFKVNNINISFIIIESVLRSIIKQEIL
jgi:hypothetical protein